MARTNEKKLQEGTAFEMSSTCRESFWTLRESLFPEAQRTPTYDQSRDPGYMQLSGNVHTGGRVTNKRTCIVREYVAFLHISVRGIKEENSNINTVSTKTTTSSLFMNPPLPAEA